MYVFFTFHFSYKIKSNCSNIILNILNSQAAFPKINVIVSNVMLMYFARQCSILQLLIDLNIFHIN
jgi:hypothetical protein